MTLVCELQLAAPPTATAPTGLAHDIVQHLPLSMVTVGDNYRRTFDSEDLGSLASNIAANRFASPVIVRPVGDGWRVVAGERRYRAHVLLAESGRSPLGSAPGWGDAPTIAAFVRLLSAEQATAVMLAENGARVDPPPLEEAQGYRRAMDAHGWTVAATARAAGVSAERVRRRVGLLELGALALELLTKGSLPVTFAERMAGLDANRQRLALLAHEAAPMTGAAWASLCRRLANEQAADSLFDTSSFMVAESYALEAVADVAPKVAPRAELVGIPEIAELLGRPRATVDKWRRRGVLPEPEWVIGHAPVWQASTVRQWATSTGRGAA